ncbi:MAG: SET domain-containing protein-lysine N-methyltransferase, partial [Bacteroidota bacterium]
QNIACDERFARYEECPPNCRIGCTNNRIQEKNFKEIYSWPSDIIPGKRGLFIMKSLEAPDLITIFPGKYIASCNLLPEQMCLKPENSESVIVPNSGDENVSAWTINHSHRPNTQAISVTTYNEKGMEIQVVGVFALEDIQGGTELTLDYHSYLQAGERPEKCLCIECENLRATRNLQEEGLHGYIQRWRPSLSRFLKKDIPNCPQELVDVLPEIRTIAKTSFPIPLINRIQLAVDELWFCTKPEHQQQTSMFQGFDTYPIVLEEHNPQIQRRCTRRVKSENIER